ncbi:PREDICTED: uncharacterized protein LOC106741474 [Dinoponera quadriceps]|uniref:Uncharacterized protein LOC106741474 n=1 Tax=Dinoponera quadriceps TaxID=609295 RepID=A0A6P3WSG8_DINQU|nr:PREDICTED: uncharacterized protein LOC106741474 [Dinoponera quadriceps]
MNECKKRHAMADEKCKGAIVGRRTGAEDANKTCGHSTENINIRYFNDSTRKLRSVLNYLSFPSTTGRPGAVRGESPIIVRNVRMLLDVMLDRSLHTTKTYHQDDSASVERSADHSKTLPNGASSGDFIHGDELPLFVEIENIEEEEADERIERPAERD